MKKVYSSVLVIATVILLITSCKENDPGLGTYKCSIFTGTNTTDSIVWSATKETIAIHAGAPVNIIGRDSVSTLIININGLTDPGTYQVQDSTASYVSYTDGPGTFDVYKSLYGSSGTITVTEINDTRVKGTFDTVVLSNSFVKKTLKHGEFDIAFE
ncbi:MAG: hypothetical protein POELPBGB_01497 [Bacteroidia bacterium]|nr:hypothetical protein [Bacteroidia bacterium]